MTTTASHHNTRTRYGACTHKCSGGNDCVCDSRPHVYHTCKDEDCDCHLQVRGAVTYEDRPRRQRVALALTQGNMLDLFAITQRIGGKRAAKPRRTPRGAQNGG